MKISEKIKILRKQSGLTQEQLAKNLGIDQTTVSKIENDERNITLDLVTKISEYFVCSLESLLEEELEPEVINIPFRSKCSNTEDSSQLRKANKIILNLREMLSLKED